MALRDIIGLAGLKLASAVLKQEQLSELALKIMPGSKKNAPVRGTKEILEAYGTMPWLRAVVNKVSRSAASTEWKALVIRSAKDGKAVYVPKLMSSDYSKRKEIMKRFITSKQFIVEELETHPVLDFISSGNPYFPGLVSLQLTQQYLDLVGEAFWVMERNTLNQPLSYFPIPPTWVSSTPNVKNKKYGLKLNGSGEEVLIPAEDVVWFYEPNPSDPYARGAGTARALADELDTDEYAAKYVKDKFFNQARPDILVAAEGLGREDTERLEENWNSKHQGLGRNSKTSFLNKNVKVHDLSPKFNELQLVELRQHERDAIFHVYGVPPELFGVLDNSNRATIESAEFLYAKHVLVPRLEFMRSVMQWRLAKEFDERLIIDFESPVDEDAERQLEAAKAAPWALQIDEWREMAGQEPLDDDAGKVHMVPFNLQPSEKLEPFDDPDNVDEEEETEEEDDEKEAKPVAKAIVQDKAPDLSELSGDVLRSVTILDEEFVRTSTWSVVESKLADMVSRFGARAIAEIGADIAFEENSRVLNWIRRNGVKRSKLYDTTTQTQMARTLSEGVRDGDTLAELADRIETLYGDIVEGRALTIARTESVRAANFGAKEGMEQAGIEKNEWLTTRDPYVRDAHASLDGQVAKVNETFVVPDGEYAGAEAAYPGDFGDGALDINCRCTIVPVFSGQERSYLDSEEKRNNGWKSFDEDRLTQERQLRRIIRQALVKQKQYVLKTLRGESIN